MYKNYIKSIIDLDLYKLTVSYGYMKMYPDAIGTFQFVDRNHSKVSQKEFVKICEGLKALEKLALTNNEFDWCVNNIKFIPLYYWEWLRQFRFNFDKIHIWVDENRELHIEVTDKLYKVTLYEIAVLAIVSEVLCAKTVEVLDWDLIKNNLLKKLEIAHEHNFKFSEFGTRRRFSFDVQDYIMKCIEHYDIHNTCVGTSNVYLAYKYNFKPIGTHPHEWFMFHGAQFGYKNANYLALKAWQDIYHGDLGIALTDTYTTDVFFKNFSLDQSKEFDGTRHDSGDPYVFAQKAIDHYKNYKIDPLTKTIVFSDGLDFPTAAEIADWCNGKILRSFGSGTNLTNDVGGKACNIVMKLISCRMNENQPEYGCIKLSDVPGKHLGNPKEIEVAKYQLNIA